MNPTPVVLASAASSKKPIPLTPAERWWAGSLFAVGLLLLAGVIAWYAVSTGDWKLVSKTTTGTGATARTTEYSDNIVVFALAAGAGLMLAGALYGRLREIRLGPVTVGIGPELPEEQQQQVSKKATARVKERVGDATQQAALIPVATALALEQARSQYIASRTTVTDMQLSSVAEAAADRVIDAAAGTNGAAV